MGKQLYNPCCSYSPVPANSFLRQASKLEGKMPLLLFPNKDSIIKPFSPSSIYFLSMSGTGLNLQTSLDGLYYRDVHDSNCI